MGRRCRGFTLIELALVILILGLAAMVVFPRLGGGALLRQQLRSSVARLVAVASHARDRAVCTRRMHVLHLDAEEGTYWVTETGPETDPPDEPPRRPLQGRLPDGVRFQAIEMPGDKSASEGTVKVRFSPEGWADAADIYLVGEDGEMRGMSIAGLSGRVEPRDVPARLTDELP